MRDEPSARDETLSGGADADRDGGGRSTDEPDDVSVAERVIMFVSVAFTVSLFAFAAWHAVVPSATASPEVTVVDAQTATDGVIVTVELTNPSDVGLLSATISVKCESPPPQLSFENVPSGGTRTGSVSCPVGTADPDVTVSTWILA